MELSEKIQMLRKKEGLSQEVFAEKMGVSRQAVSKWELGVSKPDVDKIVMMSSLFQVTTDYLLKDKQEEQTEKVVYYREVRPWHFEKKSRHTLFGLPIYHICFQGMRESGGRFRMKMAPAKGILAVGVRATGVVSIGVFARGLVAIGAAAMGMISIGAASLGILALGAFAAGIIAGGNLSVGIVAFGNLAVGMYAIGNCAVANKIALGNYAHGHIAIGNTVSGMKEILLKDANFTDMDPEAVRSMILQEFPKTWPMIQKLFTMW